MTHEALSSDKLEFRSKNPPQFFEYLTTWLTCTQPPPLPLAVRIDKARPFTVSAKRFNLKREFWRVVRSDCEVRRIRTLVLNLRAQAVYFRPSSAAH